MWHGHSKEEIKGDCKIITPNDKQTKKRERERERERERSKFLKQENFFKADIINFSCYHWI